MTLLFRTDWMHLQKHHEDVELALTEGGYNCRTKLGRVSGKELWPRLETLGHDSLDYDKCKCKQPHKLMSIEDMKLAGIPTSQEELHEKA